ncbi:MAG: hypothetical protein E5Y30_00225 [Mesorhizobium sp.]|nr:MAG: hypothetical protein E5Y30_00225 [Mesorhizobium sp.]
MTLAALIQHTNWIRSQAHTLDTGILATEQPGQYPDPLLRTLQRRLKIWRKEKAHAMVFGPMHVEPGIEPIAH